MCHLTRQEESYHNVYTNHRSVHLKYLTILCVNYTSTRLEGKKVRDASGWPEPPLSRTRWWAIAVGKCWVRFLSSSHPGGLSSVDTATGSDFESTIPNRHLLYFLYDIFVAICSFHETHLEALKLRQLLKCATEPFLYLSFLQSFSSESNTYLI